VGAKFIIFPKDFSRGALIAGAVGTSGTAAEFFDRSPFFFTPSETDPNTLRDISEAEQFLIFSSANITSFDPFRNTPSSTIIISDKGEELSETGVDPLNIISNGGFEQGLSNWDITNAFGTPVVVTSTPTGGTFTPGCCPPPEGSRMLHFTTSSTSTEGWIQTEVDTPRRRLRSQEVIKDFSFNIASGVVDSNRRLSIHIQFFQENLDFKTTTKVYEIKYGISGLGAATPNASFNPIDLNPTDTRTLSPTLQPDTFTSYTTSLLADIGGADFEFDSIRFVLATGGTGVTDFLIDNIQLTLNIAEIQLLSTSTFAHVDTTHPVSASGFGLDSIPFTISGSDNINQVDLTAPFFANTSPASGSLNNPETSDLEFHIQDISSALDQGTIEVKVDGELVVTAGTTVTGSNFPVAFKTVLAPNDIEYIFRRGPNWTPGSTVTVSGEFADFAAVSNFGEETYQFEIVGSGGLGATISGAPDATPPVILPTEPASSATQVSANTDIKFTITDDASGVDPSTVKLLLNGATKIENDTATGGTFARVTNTSNGFDYTYDSDGQFTFGETVTGSITASDFAGNSDTVAYEFTVTPDDTLSIENFFLGLDESTLLTTGTLMSVDLIDELYGVASGTSFLTVNGAVPSGLVTVFSGIAASGTCPIQQSFLVPLEPLVDFREDLVVLVHAENCFPGSFPIIQEQQFTLRPGYDVKWPNKTEDAEGGPEVVFPYVTNIQVLSEVKNFAKNFGEASTFFRFLTEDQQKKSLGATIISNIQVADLPATMEILSPFFEYGKTMVLDLEVKDLEGNTFTLTHTFVIEPKP